MSLNKDWIKEIWHIWTIDYYTFVKENDMKFADKWVGLGKIILCRGMQTQKDKYGM